MGRHDEPAPEERAKMEKELAEAVASVKDDDEYVSGTTPAR